VSPPEKHDNDFCTKCYQEGGLWQHMALSITDCENTIALLLIVAAFRAQISKLAYSPEQTAPGFTFNL
jgi:hypothetical protein